jgi:hypothetical protein
LASALLPTTLGVIICTILTKIVSVIGV